MDWKAALETAAKEIGANILGLDLSPILAQIPKGSTAGQIETILLTIWENPEFKSVLIKMMAYAIGKIP